MQIKTSLTFFLNIILFTKSLAYILNPEPQIDKYNQSRKG